MAEKRKIHSGDTEDRKLGIELSCVHLLILEAWWVAGCGMNQDWDDEGLTHRHWQEAICLQPGTPVQILSLPLSASVQTWQFLTSQSLSDSSLINWGNIIIF